MKELENLVFSLLMYQYVKIDHMNYEDAVELIGHKSSDLRQVKKHYSELCKVLDMYQFTAQESVK